MHKVVLSAFGTAEWKGKEKPWGNKKKNPDLS